MTTKTTMTRFLCGTMLLAGLSNACGEEVSADADEGALTDLSVPALEDNAPGQTVFNGVATSPSAPADIAEATRDVAVTAYSASFAAELADAELATEAQVRSATASTASTESTSSVSAAATSGRKVSITGEKQQRPYWCVPASSRITLSALRSSPPSQTTLAQRESTTTNGTAMRNVPGPLNAYQSKNHFLYSTSTSSASNLVARVRYDIDSLKSPLIPALEGAYLPAWRARGYSGYHAIVIYGWNVATKKPYNLNLYDPLNVSWSGAYNVPASTVYTAMRARNNDLVW